MQPKNYIPAFVRLCQNDIVATGQKAAFLRQGKLVLKQIANDLGLNKSEYDLRINPGGPAVSGEIILHSDRLYIQISQGSMGNTFLYRSCKNRRDYAGGTNRYVPFDALRDHYDSAISALRNTMAE